MGTFSVGRDTGHAEAPLKNTFLELDKFPVITRAVSRHDLSHQLVISRSPEVPNIQLVGLSYLQEGFSMRSVLLFWGRPKRPGGADFGRLTKEPQSRLIPSSLRQPTCRLKSVGLANGTCD